MAAVLNPGASSAGWHAFIEATPQLNQCRLFLWRRPNREGQLEKELNNTDHRGWTAQLQPLGRTLQVRLEPHVAGTKSAEFSAAEGSAILSLDFGLGDRVTAERLCAHKDHLCIYFGSNGESPWDARLLPQSVDDGMDDISELSCRRCQHGLLLPPGSDGRIGYLLPSTMWQACADIMACEECAPLGVEHFAAIAGRVYISPQCLVVSEADVEQDVIQFGRNGLVRCRCGSVVGETQVHWANVQRAPKVQRKRLFCQDGWNRSTACRSEGIAFYKHRVSRISHGTDYLAAYTEASAVGAHLLASRASDGNSRFVIVRGPPTEEVTIEQDDKFVHDDGLDIGQAIELRLAVAEVATIGPVRPTAIPNGQQGKPARRTAKVYFRTRSCNELSPECKVVGVPPAAFDDVLESLSQWTNLVPESLCLCPMSSKDGHGKWITSWLPLPPRDSATE